MNDILLKIIELVVLVVVMVASTYILPWLRNSNLMGRLTLVCTWADTFVRAAELIFPEVKSGANKKDYVLDALSRKVSELGYSVTVEDLNAIIEEAVKKMKESE